MRPPCELVQREYLPALRSTLAAALHARGLSQNRIAAMMDITQAAVSKYLSNPIEATIGKKQIAALAEKLANGLVDGSLSSDRMVTEICTTCIMLRIGGDICHRHRQVVPSLGEAGCRICADLLSGQEMFRNRAGVMDDMEHAVEIIERSRAFIRLLPQVRASLVACEKDAETVDQVIGIPGRITDIGSRAKAPAPPEFGASRHTAQILLWAKERLPSIRACICIAGTDDVVNAAKRAGFEVITLAESAREAARIAQMATALLPKKQRRTQLYGIRVPGGLGVEPVLYLFGLSAVELATKSVEIAEALD
ncbi:MAG: thiamine-phosphate synthase family protein [Candidatus Thorarchaeota archaeon]